MTIQEKVLELLSLRSQIDEIENSIVPIKKQKEALQGEIIADMKEQNFKSVKTQEATISIKATKTMKIVDERMVISQLKAKGLTDYIIEAVDKELWKGFSAEAIKQNMPLLGTEIKETEYISVLKNKASNANEENND